MAVLIKTLAAVTVGTVLATNAFAQSTRIDTGKNTLHMIGPPRSHSSLACPVQRDTSNPPEGGTR